MEYKLTTWAFLNLTLTLCCMSHYTYLVFSYQNGCSWTRGRHSQDIHHLGWLWEQSSVSSSAVNICTWHLLPLYRSALGTEAKLGPNKSVLDIGDGQGFVSCCGLITCDWVGAAPEEKLPKNVVIKVVQSHSTCRHIHHSDSVNSSSPSSEWHPTRGTENVRLWRRKMGRDGEPNQRG